MSGEIKLSEVAASGLDSIASGKGALYLDSAGILFVKDDAGRYNGQSSNAGIAAQGPGFATDTYITNSNLIIPSFGFQTKAIFTWRVSASKSGAGTATPVYSIRIGANGTAADTARLTLTGPAQTAIADIGTLNIVVVVRAVSATVGVIQGTAWWDHRGTAASTTVSGTGFANDTTGHVEGTSSNFDNSALGGQYIGLSINGGGSAAWTTTLATAEAQW